jgi:hypothetical protein
MRSYEGELMNRGLNSEDGSVVKTPIIEQHFPPMYYAQRWGLTAKTVSLWFRDEPGVLKIKGGLQGRRTTLRIPMSVAEKVYKERASLV